MECKLLGSTARSSCRHGKLLGMGGRTACFLLVFQGLRCSFWPCSCQYVTCVYLVTRQSCATNKKLRCAACRLQCLPETHDSQEQDSQEQLYSPGSSRQTHIPEFYHLILFGFGSEKAVLCTGICGGERLPRGPKPLGSK